MVASLIIFHLSNKYGMHSLFHTFHLFFTRDLKFSSGAWAAMPWIQRIPASTFKELLPWQPLYPRHWACSPGVPPKVHKGLHEKWHALDWQGLPWHLTLLVLLIMLSTLPNTPMLHMKHSCVLSLLTFFFPQKMGQLAYSPIGYKQSLLCFTRDIVWKREGRVQSWVLLGTQRAVPCCSVLSFCIAMYGRKI